MRNPTPEERYTKTFAFLIVIALVVTLLMRGVNVRLDVPNVLYIAVAIICGSASVLSYMGFIYCKMFKPTGSKMLMDMCKIILLGVMVYFTVAFAIRVMENI